MSSVEISTLLKAKLQYLFSKFKEVLTDPKQQEIIQRGFIFSRINPSARVLVMGINPSLRTDFVHIENCSYAYPELGSDRYFKKFHTLLKDYDSLGITYCDLFYQRHSEQAQIDYFLSDEQGKKFLKEQLKITRELIMQINPKIILLFNRRGAQFFSEEWLGFTFTELKQEIPNTQVKSLFKLQGTEIHIYCSAFLGYRTPRSTYEQLDKDLPKIFSLLSKHNSY